MSTAIRKLTYGFVSVLMIMHAAFLSFIFDHDTRHWDHPSVPYSIWWVLFWIWPAWIGLLWTCRLKSGWSIGVPIIIGLLTMSPGLFMILIAWAVGTAKHI